MLNCIVIGDPHFKVSNVQETDEMTEKLLNVIRQRKPSFIVCLGDVLDTFSRVHISPLTRATRFLSDLRDIAPTYLLIGNHDIARNDMYFSEEHPFTSLLSWNNMKVAQKPFVETIQGKKFIFCPYVPVGRFSEALSTLVPEGTTLPEYLKDITAIFAHQEFRNAKMGAVISATGDEWPSHYPYVISGHIHDYDELTANILYVGTPMQHGYNENESKTVSWFDWSGNEMVKERIDLQLTKKKIIHVRASDLCSFVPPTGYHLKVIIEGTLAEYKSALKLSIVSDLKASGAEIRHKYVPLTDPNSKIPLGPIKIVKFGQRFYDAMSADPDLLELHKRLFGIIKVEEIVKPVILRPKIVIKR